MWTVDLGADDFDDAGFVLLANISGAIARAIGGDTPLETEYAWLRKVLAAVDSGQLIPRHPETYADLKSGANSTAVVPFDEVVKWGRHTEQLIFARGPDAEKTAIRSERLSVSMQQDQAILGWLESNGYDPKSLPVAPKGKKGIKKDCRDSLCQNSRSLFSSTSVFNTAWDRLRANQEIIDAQ